MAKPSPTLKDKERLKKNQQFQEIYLEGAKVKTEHLALCFKANQLPYSRIGLSVSKKRFKLSCLRHYILRRLRAAYQVNKGSFLPGYDLVLCAQRFNKKKISFHQLSSELLLLAKKAQLSQPQINRAQQENCPWQ